MLLFLPQPLLVRYGALRLHRQIGRVGLPLAIGVAVTMLPAGVFQVARDVAAGAGPTGVSAMLGVLTSGIIFVALVAAGIAARRDREAHPRWLLLATLFVIWPAWFRFRHWFPQVPRPDIWFGAVLSNSWVLVAMLRDKRSRGAVHPVLLYKGGAVIAETAFELLAFDMPW